MVTTLDNQLPVRTFGQEVSPIDIATKASITDLHICKKSITTNSSSKSSECNCPPEYVCVDICPEGGFSVSTLISWQHFPRSTSIRSECDDSDELTRKSLTSTESKTAEPEEKESTKGSTAEYPVTKSFAQLNALHYLEVRHVFQLLNFLISHLVCNEPNDPVDFLVNLLEKCLKYRDSFGEPPHLFTHAHLKSAYNAFDPFERGYLTLPQYKEAMKTLGLENSITPYNPEPPVNEDDCVEENTFIFEAERCLTENLKAMLRIPKLWEDNRQIWKKKMVKKKPRVVKKASESGEHTDVVIVETKKSESKCSIIEFRKCSRGREVRYEPEQLFFK